MDKWPRISIVTPSFNQGKFISETIESVQNQNYPNLEHIVIDGGSTDGTLQILQKFSHLKIVSEPDHGQANAINKGFDMATGDIYGYLNSDDTLLPGALKRVAQEIAPESGRHIIMGRCRFVDERGQFIGIEHPCHFKDHRRVLEVWKGHMIPQPAVFWTSEVWNTCGPLNENLNSSWIDYDLFCRFSKKHFFQTIDQVLATYRLHSESKTGLSVEIGRLEECIPLSRRHWGSPFSFMYWQLAGSLNLYRFNRVGRARDTYLRAQENYRQHRRIRAIFYYIAAAFLAPEVAFYVGIYPALKVHSIRFVGKFLTWLAIKRGMYPQTEAYLDRTKPWEDGWIGPRLVVSREVESGVQNVKIQGEVDLRFISAALILTLFVDGENVGESSIVKNGNFRLELPLLQPLTPGLHTLEIQASAWWVNHQFTRNGDYRPLAWRITHQDAIVLSSRDMSLIFADHTQSGSSSDGFNFLEGFHDAEFKGLDWVRWSSGRGQLNILADCNMTAFLRGDVCTICYPNKMDILVNSEKIETLEIAWEGFKPIRTNQFNLVKGQNKVTLISHNEATTSSKDSRHLAFALRNAILEVNANNLST